MSLAITYKDLKPWAIGTTKTIRLNLSINGEPLALTGVTFKFWLLDSDGMPNSEALVEKTVSEHESEFDSAISLNPDDSTGLEAKIYSYRINAIIGGESKRIIKGKLPVEN